MPRVPESHLEARRDQILSAARRCFSRNGFHATSMQDVIEEAGLSVGAVYRYFKSKDEIRTAVAEETVGAMLDEIGGITAHEPPLPLFEAMTRVVRVVEPRLAGADPVARIAVQAWGEALRDPDLGRFVSGMIRTIQDHFTAIARQAQQAGDLPAGTDPRAVGTALMALLPGYIMQRVLTGRPDADTYLTGLRALLPAPGPALTSPRASSRDLPRASRDLNSVRRGGHPLGGGCQRRQTWKVGPSPGRVTRPSGSGTRSAAPP